MRDILLIPTEDQKADIDIVDGEPVFVSSEQATYDQRAAVGAFMALGTIPGMEDRGVDWMSVYNGKANLLDVDSQVKRQVQEFASSTSANYSSLMVPNTDEKGPRYKVVTFRM